MNFRFQLAGAFRALRLRWPAGLGQRALQGALVGALALGLGGAAQAATWYVSPNGSDGASGSQSAPWKTISWALSSSSPVGAGDTVLIQPGTYTEDVVCQKSGTSGNPITVKGNGNTQSLIDSAAGTPNVVVNEPNTGADWNGSGPPGLIWMSGQHDLVFDGLYLKNPGFGGFTIRGCTNVTVQNCWTYNSGSSGILPVFAGGGSDTPGEWEIQNHNIKALHNRIQQATQKNSQEAISFWGVDGFEIANNYVYDSNCEGIDAKVGTRNGSIHNNEVWNCGVVTAQQWGYGAPCVYVDAGAANASNIDVYANYVHDTWGNGYSVNSENINYTVSNVRVFNNVCVTAGRSGKCNTGFTVGQNASHVWFFNNTGMGNGTDFLAASNNSNCAFVNNIMASAIWRPFQIDQTSNLLMSYNVIRNDGPNGYSGYGSGQDANTTATNNIYVPLSGIGLKNTANNTRDCWNLVSGSPAINAGTNSIGNGGPSAPSTDFYGNGRPAGGGYDIGAHEYGASGSGGSSGGALFQTGFESNNPQPTWTNAPDNNNWSSTGNPSNVTGYISGVGPECGVRSGNDNGLVSGPHAGSQMLMTAGTANSSGGSDFVYFKVFDFSANPLTIGTNTTLSYWINPYNTNGRYVAVDFHFTDGSNLRDSGIKDQNGFSVHPNAGHGGNSALGQWSQIIANLGSLAGKKVDRLWIAYDHPNTTGQFRAYLDDVSIK